MKIGHYPILIREEWYHAPKKDQPVVYRKSPLIQVTCQLMFPTTLKIPSQLPVGFQDKVRLEFPLFAVNQNTRAYNFLSEDRTWQLTLEQGSLALVTTRYAGWDQFTRKLQVSVKALCEEFTPNSFLRMGLRYRNAIRRSGLGLDAVEWSQLLKAQLVGTSVWNEVGTEIREYKGEIVVRLNGNNHQVRILHGLVNVTGPTTEVGYLIDHDFFAEGNTAISEAFSTLDSFQREADRLFRWWISDMLHQAMEPAAT